MAQLGSKTIGSETMGLVNQDHGSGLSQVPQGIWQQELFKP